MDMDIYYIFPTGVYLGFFKWASTGKHESRYGNLGGWGAQVLMKILLCRFSDASSLSIWSILAAELS